ncbi:hypothetical protein NW765_007783 [Fusarium oxysporum]|nr:hypothetical protein NW765_007783 [Fusarium oxysporum]
MPIFEAPRRLTFRAIGSFRELKDSYPGLGLGDRDGLGFGSRADCNFTTIISFSFSKCHSFRWRMDSQNGVLSSLVVGSTFSPNLDILSRYAGLSPPSPLETLKTPSPIDYEASTTVEHRSAARALLVRARTSDAGYRPPDQQKRHLLRVPSRRNLKLNEERWTFTKHEVGKALNELLSAAPLPDVQVAHVVLASVHIDSLDELWEHFKDSKLQKRQSSIFRRSTSSNNGLSNWLSIVTGQENIPYIHLLCQYGAGPNLLNQAFVIALARHDIPSMKLLLSFGACILPICKDYVRLSVTKNDVDVIGLLLSAPKGMNVEDWQYSLEANIEGAPRGYARQEFCFNAFITDQISQPGNIFSKPSMRTMLPLSLFFFPT